MRIAPARAALPLLALALAALPARAQTQKPARRAVAGVVVDSTTGRPLAAAVVSIGRREVVTDTAGRFAFSRIPDGAATLSAEQLGYGDRDVEVVVSEALRSVRIALVPDPVKLKAITVMTDRFRSRRNSVPISVQAFDRTALLASGAFNLTDFLQYRGGMIAHPCSGSEPSAGFGGPFGLAVGWTAIGGGLCTLVRGQWIEPSVWIDDRRAFSDELSGYNPAEIFLVEVYGHGRMIRAYTTWWAESRRPLEPIWY